MGRSVSYAPGAIKIVYLSPDINSEDEDESEFLWDHFKDELFYLLSDKYKSLSPVKNEWANNETKTIFENNIIKIHLSEYCGLVSLSFTASNEEKIGLAIGYLNKINKGLYKLLEPFKPLSKIGSFSNGESIYERI